MRETIYWVLGLSALIALNGAASFEQDDDEDLDFPEGFTIGAAGSSHQMEGGWNVSGKGENIWDHYAHTKPWLFENASNADVACDSYHKYKEDVQWLKKIGFDLYRFSVSWSRILPTGFANNISKDGIQYYKNLIDELHANGIEPSITLYHWDHPQILEEMGGWTNELMVDWFEDYARVVFRELGPKVKIITTFNEPSVFCIGGYSSNVFAPGKELHGIGRYLCGQNILKAHATVYHMYDTEFRPTQNGKITIGTSCGHNRPKNPGDTTSAEIDFQFTCGWMAHPIFSETGDYPEIMKQKIAENSKTEGYPRSRLPELSPEWVNYIKGTADFFALNHYTTGLVEPGAIGDGLFSMDSGIVRLTDFSAPKTGCSWITITPFGFGDVLRKIKEEYNNPPVYVMENGVADSGTLSDYQRMEYFHSYLKELLKAVKRDGCNVVSYTLWSLIDVFEWTWAYTIRFGIIQVDFNSPNRTRKAKLSASWWEDVLRTRKLQPVISDSDSKHRMDLNKEIRNEL